MSRGLHHRRRTPAEKATRAVGGRLAIVIGAVLLATVVIGPPLAAAPRSATGTTTDGAAADCVVAAVSANLVRIICGITDLSRDGDSVYVAWRTTSGGVRSIYDREGAGTTISATAYAPSASAQPPHRVLWRVCRDRQAPWRDACSEWRTVWAKPTAA